MEVRKPSWTEWSFLLYAGALTVLGAALAPTDPAVMFSILGDKELGGHTGTILEGEAGVNDPVGIVGAALLVVFMRKVRLPSEGLYPLRSLAAAGVIYGLAAVAHGSGFLAVFIAGLALSDARPASILFLTARPNSAVR